jgi:hypothetical protein
MTKYLSRILMVGLCLILSMPSQAQTPSIGPAPGGGTIGGVTKGEIIGIIVGVVAAITVVAIVVVHESRKTRTITGCVSSGPNGMILTNEKDKHSYALSGNTAGVKPGERITVQGKKINPSAGKPLTWDTKAITSDLGVCQQ